MGAAALEAGRQEKVRAFFGLPLPEPHRAELARFVQLSAVAAPAFRWTPSANLHLTVRFVGSVERRIVDAVAEHVAAVRPPRLELALGPLGTFRRGRLTRVVWLGVTTGAAELAKLATLVDAECVKAGLEGEERAFKSHLTLARARLREGADLPSLAPAPELGPWRADDLVLYSSRPGPGGSIYEPLRRISLE